MHPTRPQVDALRELLALGVGRADGLLRDLSGGRASAQMIGFALAPPDGATSTTFSAEEPLVAVALGVDGKLASQLAFVVPSDSARALISAFLSDRSADEEFDPLRTSVMTEIGGVILSAVLASFMSVAPDPVDSSYPLFREGTRGAFALYRPGGEENRRFAAPTKIQIDQLCVSGDVVMMMPRASFSTLLGAIDDWLVA